MRAMPRASSETKWRVTRRPGRAVRVVLTLCLSAQLAPAQGLQESEIVAAPAECAHGHPELSARVAGRIDTVALEPADAREVQWLCTVCQYVGSWQLEGWVWTHHSEDPYSFYSPLDVLLEEFPVGDAMPERNPRYSQLRDAEGVKREFVSLSSKASLEELVDLAFDHLQSGNLTFGLSGTRPGRVSLSGYDQNLALPAWDYIFHASVDCSTYRSRCQVRVQRERAFIPDAEAGGRGGAMRRSEPPKPIAREELSATASAVAGELQSQASEPKDPEEGRPTRPRALDRPMVLPPESKTWPTGAVQFEIQVFSSGQAGEVRCLSENQVLCRGFAKVVADWRFEPATKDGVPVDGVYVTNVNFQRQPSGQRQP